jgi:TnpA family transposase
VEKTIFLCDYLGSRELQYEVNDGLQVVENWNATNEVIAKRMVKKQQMRWNRFTIQPFITVRVHVLNGTLDQVFRRRYAGFRPAIAA